MFILFEYYYFSVSIKRTITVIRIKLFWILLFLGAQIVTLSGFQYSIFRYKQSVIRSEIKRAIKEGVPEDELVDFRFHIKEESWKNLEWTKPEKEFRFNNQMYDVVETQKSNDTIYFKCIHDVKESGLFHQIDLLTNQRSSKDKSLVVYWSQQIYSAMNGVVSQKQTPKLNAKPIIYFYQESKFKHFLASPIPPPPKT